MSLTLLCVIHEVVKRVNPKRAHHKENVFFPASSILCLYELMMEDLPGGSVVKNLLPVQETQETTGLIPGSGRFPGKGNVNPLQYFCLGSPVDRGAWWATVSAVAECQTRLSTRA